MPRKSPVERAQAAVQRVVDRLAKARAVVASLEADLANLRGLTMPVPAMPQRAQPAPVDDDPDGALTEAGDPGDLSDADNLGPGRWA